MVRLSRRIERERRENGRVGSREGRGSDDSMDGKKVDAAVLGERAEMAPLLFLTESN